MLQKRNWESDSHRVHFESGVRMGVGAFNLVGDISTICFVVAVVFLYLFD